jgi:hypothetical protein
MKHLWKCLLLAGVCALLAPGTSNAQTPPTSQANGLFRVPTFSSSRTATANQRTMGRNVIQSNRQRATSQSMFSRVSNFVWSLGGLRSVPRSPVTVPSTRRPF